MAPGQTMAPGDTMPGMGAATPSPAQPSDAARMICANETILNIKKILGLAATPVPDSAWNDQLYTCTYRLPYGSLVLSVKQSAGDALARSYFERLRAAATTGQAIEGMANLGLPAFKTGTSVSFVKDNMTLLVDAGHLPASVGPHEVSRSALAYEVATAVLACWQGG
ncbi:hypothetical protein [Specibacter cremeus]|uniref:hypothetical protein n=1 Tax=Specibacter cremeus TaxID=1629051 RepID=UPI000F7B47F2|nr:hypothetical protein [Specibacter cremeus]